MFDKDARAAVEGNLAVELRESELKPEEEMADELHAAPFLNETGGGRAILTGGSVGEDLSVSWENEEAFQTFYWQVQALGHRSPDAGRA